MTRRRRREPDVIDIGHTDISDGTPVNGKVRHYDPNLHEPPMFGEFLPALRQSIAAFIVPQARQARDHEMEKTRLANKGELALMEKAIAGELMSADISNAKNAAIEHIHATEEVTQEEIRSRTNIALTEYQETKALESQKKEADVKQIQVDAMKMRRQLEEIEDLGLSPQDEEWEKERVRRAWRGEVYAHDSHQASKRK